MGKKVDIKKALQKFRNHWIHDNDINRYLEMEQTAGEEVKKILDTVPDDQLGQRLSEYIGQLPQMDEFGIRYVMENNTIQQVRHAFETLYDAKKTEAERLDAMWALEGVGHIYASYFLDMVTRGGYIIYETAMVTALRDLEPGLLREDFIEVWNREDLEYLMDACRKIYKKYGFASYAELKAFLLNGYGSQWTFEGLG